MQVMVLFNIDNLISPLILKEIEGLTLLSDKIKFLFKLLDYTFNFSPEYIDSVKYYYLERTGEKYSPVYLDQDQQEFILEYAEYFNDYNEVKILLNGICNDITRDEAIASAQKRIADEKNRIKQELHDKSVKFLDELLFDDDVSNDEKKIRTPLDELLKQAKKYRQGNMEGDV